MKILKVENLSKVYGTKNSAKTYRALKNISFGVEEGDFIGVMGASGSGKTTLLNMIGSIDKPTSGQIFMNNKDVASFGKQELAKHRINNIGFIFQDFNLLETMTLKENIILPLALKGVSGEIIEDRLRALVDDLGIRHVLDKYPYEVSGGEQQRAAACRALITEPKVILADEPTGNLDSASTKDLLELFTYMNLSFSSTILMVTHDAFAASYCKKILFIRDGEIYNELVAGGDKKQFYRSILDVMNVLGGHGK